MIDKESNESEEINETYQNHLKLAETSYAEKRNDKERALSNENFAVASFDLE